MSTIIFVISISVLQCNCEVICIDNSVIADTLNCRPIGILFNVLKKENYEYKQTRHTLVLRDCNVGMIDYEYFQPMMNLKHLDLSMNLLKELPRNIFYHLKGLKSLNASRNIIHTIDKDVFSNMIQLKEVDLSYNYLKITYKLFGKSLKFLDFSHNVEVDIAQSSFEDLQLETLILKQSLKKFPDTFQFSGIVHLDVSENRNFVEMGKIGKQFEHLDKLSHLNMADCGLIEIEIASNKKLRVLNVSRNAILLNEHTFHSNAELVEVDLCSNEIETLPNYVFDSCGEMIKLHLCDNRLTNLRAESFSKMSKLRVLDLSRNRLKTAVKFPDAIASLDLSYNQLELIDDSVFDDMKLLFDLNLSGNLLSSVNLKMFQHPSLEYLNLRCNRYVGMSKEYFGNRNTLLNLYLGGNPWYCACISFLFQNDKNLNNVEFHDELSCVADKKPKNNCNVSDKEQKKFLESYNKGPNPCESNKK